MRTKDVLNVRQTLRTEDHLNKNQVRHMGQFKKKSRHTDPFLKTLVRIEQQRNF